MQFSDEWLVPTLSTLVPEAEVEAIRGEGGKTPGSLWEALVAKRRMTDAEILAAISSRFRLPLADLSQAEARSHEGVPEQLARKYNILPLRVTNSLLEVASANPFIDSYFDRGHRHYQSGDEVYRAAYSMPPLWWHQRH
jgi:hypothetical protein